MGEPEAFLGEGLLVWGASLGGVSLPQESRFPGPIHLAQHVGAAKSHQPKRQADCTSEQENGFDGILLWTASKTVISFEQVQQWSIMLLEKTKAYPKLENTAWQ